MTWNVTLTPEAQPESEPTSTPLPQTETNAQNTSNDQAAPAQTDSAGASDSVEAEAVDSAATAAGPQASSGSNVNVRNGPGTDFDVSGTLAAGETLEESFVRIGQTSAYYKEASIWKKVYPEIIG